MILNKKRPGVSPSQHFFEADPSSGDGPKDNFIASEVGQLLGVIILHDFSVQPVQSAAYAARDCVRDDGDKGIRKVFMDVDLIP
jgi:hypothetical protein